MIFIINTLWIIVISWLLCWFCTSSDRRVWFHFTNIWCKIAQGIWQLGAMSLSLVFTGYSPSDSPCMHIAFVLCIFWLCQVRMSWNLNCWHFQWLVHSHLIHRHRMKRLGHRCCPITSCYRWPEILLTLSQHLAIKYPTVTISRQTHLLTQPQNAQNEYHVPT